MTGPEGEEGRFGPGSLQNKKTTMSPQGEPSIPHGAFSAPIRSGPEGYSWRTPVPDGSAGHRGPL